MKTAAVTNPLLPTTFVDWPSEQQRVIHRSWGQTFSRLLLNAAAKKYFDKCIDEHVGQDYCALYLRSKFHRSVARAPDALKDSLRALALAGGHDADIHLELADVLYDLNKFEDNKLMLEDNIRKHVGSLATPFKKRLMVVNGNFADCLGAGMGTFFLKNVEFLKRFNAQRRREEEDRKDKRPQWIRLQESGDCDVQSLIDKQDEMLSPLEKARRKRKKKIFYQNYLNRAWTDIFFLKSLRHNPNLLLEQCSNLSKERGKQLEDTFTNVKTFTRMLHARSPMYHEMFNRRGTFLSERKMRENNLFRVQYQTRRNMLSILRTIRSFRRMGEVQRLRNFVEEVMGEYVVLKTHRIMPWKLEFMNEVYNHLALSLCENYRLPITKVTPYDKNALCQLLNMKVSKHADYQEFVFGDRSTYAEGDLMQPGRLAHKRLVAQLEHRLIFASLPIERTYLLHELADRHVHRNQFVQCLSYARKSIDEARRCNSKIWEFLSTMLMAKSHAVLHKYERQTEVLDSAYNLALELKSPKLCTFIELCRMLNKDYIILRKMTQVEANRRLKTKASTRVSHYSPSQSLNGPSFTKYEDVVEERNSGKNA